MICFDHAAAAPVLSEIRERYPVYLAQYSGNPEAAHAGGAALRRELQSCAERLAKALLFGRKVLPEYVVFYGHDATELLNMAGVVCGNTRAAAWGSALDHPAGSLMLERNFERIEKFSLSSCGQITSLPETAARPAMVLINHVQSEIGVRQNLAELIPKLRKVAPGAVILLDCVQSALLEEYLPDVALPDLQLISGVKLGAGSGAALIAWGEKAGEFKRRWMALRRNWHLTGRMSVVPAVALTETLEIIQQRRDAAKQQIEAINHFLRSRLQDMVLPNGRKIIFTVPAAAASGNILHFILPGYQSGVLVRMFSAENILLAAGSACQSESDEPSVVLSSLKYSRSDSYSGLRLSFWLDNTLDEARIFMEKISHILKNY